MIRLSKAKVFLILCLVFMAGIGIRSLVVIPFWLIYSMGLVGLVLVILMWHQKKVLIIGLCLIVASLGILRFEMSEPRVNENAIQFYNGEPARFIGLVTAEPDVRENHVKLTVKAVQGMESIPKNLTGNVLVNTQLYPEYDYGDVLDIKCRLKAPEPIQDDKNSRVFEYDKYLARFNIYSLCYRPQIDRLATGQGNPVMQVILNIKNTFTKRLTKVIAEPEVSFVGGLILGARKAIPDELIQAFNRTGTTHIIALSGYNITIIAVFIQNLCRALWIPRGKSFWVAITAITFFIILTGASASVVRAGIMGGLVLLAQQVGRTSRVTNVLILAAVVMLLINPKVLVFDAGFQLSFLATIGLVYLAPLLERLFTKLPNVLEIRSSLVATLSAIIMTTPLILLTFGRLSIVAPLVNVIILPLIPFAMALGFITGIAGIIWLPIGMIIGWIGWALLRLILYIIEWFSALPFISIMLPPLHWIWPFLIYLVIFTVLYKFKKRPLMALAQKRS